MRSFQLFNVTHPVTVRDVTSRVMISLVSQLAGAIKPSVTRVGGCYQVDVHRAKASFLNR